jgi:hypothetical protein
VAIVEIQHNRIRRRVAPAMSAANLRGSDHFQSFSILASLRISITVGEAR